ncbi:hypothetical protein COLO4_19844 [Corchorus olitorius]|uniref:Uncharacterized protein n=1 Tax=Corchorus olitorius TaxID=93759 RepID=A0A1R3J323_9ROSI|nr:hypothetical protein COLO4_19844 [Corchorus olitorius]
MGDREGSIVSNQRAVEMQGTELDELNGTSIWVRGEGVSGMDVTPAMESEHVQDDLIDEHTGDDVF